MSGQDEIYKQLFSHPSFVRQLIEGFAPPELAQQLDFATLKNHSGEYITPRLGRKLQDLVWSARLLPQDANEPGERVYLYILLEFQSRTDHSMPLRMLQYVAALYEQIVRVQRLKLSKDRLPLVFPLVLYSGDSAWRAQSSLQGLLPRVPEFLRRYQPQLDYFLVDEKRLSGLESADTVLASMFATGSASQPEEIMQALARLVKVFQAHPEHAQLERIIGLWLRSELKQRKIAINLDDINLLEIETMAKKTLDDWSQEWFADGVERGMEKGMVQGMEKGRSSTLKKLLQLKFGAVAAQWLERLNQASEQQLELWTERILFADSIEAVFQE